jgi:hypothetical protein
MVKLRIVLQRLLDIMEEIKFFVTKENKNIEEPNDELWISDLAFLVDMTCHLNYLHKELKARVSLLLRCLIT